MPDFEPVFLVQKRVAHEVDFVKDVQRMWEKDWEHLEMVAGHGEELLVFRAVQVPKAEDEAQS